MNRDGTIRTEFQLELPRTQCPGLGGELWGSAKGVVSGRADPDRAIVAFDAARAQPFETTVGVIQQNIVGWASWAAGEMFRRWATERDVTELLSNPTICTEEFRAAVAPQFDPWTFVMESVELEFHLADEAVGALPEAARARLAPPPTGAGVLEHSFSGDIPSAKDPVTGHDIQVRCNVQVTFDVNLDTAREALDMTGGQMSPERLEREILAKCEEWFWYGVKQSFYDWIFDTSQPHRRFVRDYSLIHPKVMTLCEQGLDQVGATVKTAMVRYEALDQDSAWSLTAPGSSGAVPAVTPGAGGGPVAAAPAPGAPPTSGPVRITPEAPGHRAGSDQAMAATIAIMDPSELPLPNPQAPPGADQPLPSIEEAVWRHQKRVMKNKPGLSRTDTAAEILMLLKQDGYSLDDRQRIAGVIGADSASVVE